MCFNITNFALEPHKKNKNKVYPWFHKIKILEDAGDSRLSIAKSREICCCQQIFSKFAGDSRL